MKAHPRFVLRSALPLASILAAAPSAIAAQPSQEAPAVSVEESALAAVADLVVPIEELEFTGDVPDWNRVAWLRSTVGPAVLPRVVVPGWDAEVEIPIIERGMMPFVAIRAGDLALRAADEAQPAGDVIEGTLMLSSFAGDQLELFPFTVARSALTENEDRAREVWASRYEALAGAAIPGTAWFRRRAESFGGDPAKDENWTARRSYSRDDTFAMFTGGRALAENLALDDVIGGADDGPVVMVPIADIETVTVPEMDFTSLIEGKDIALDALGSSIPFDQHAVFFPSFDSLLRVADQVGGDAAPLVYFLDGRSQSSGVRERYERQMSLRLPEAGRLLARSAVEAVAVTGSDTYLRTGSDVAVLLRGNAAAIGGMVRAQMALGAKEHGVGVEELVIGEVSVAHAVSPSRVLSTYLASVNGTVVVSNSEAQMRRVLRTMAGGIDSLATLAEYRWFRDRYPLGAENEDALAIVSDATIRRWAGPKWRIATSRRTRAAAILADAEAWRLGNELDPSAGGKKPTASEIPGGGAIGYEHGLAIDEQYGTLEFQTPIAELDFDTVSEFERDGYLQWRRGYERMWTASFDPLAVRVQALDDGLDIDLTLVPLVVRTDYRDLINLAGETTLSPDSGDFHEDAIVHWVSAIDKESRLYRDLSGYAGAMGNNALGLNWLGDHIAVFVDEDDEYFASLGDVDSIDEALQEHLPGLPVGVHIGVDSPLALAGFLTGVRGLLKDAVPGMFQYETREHDGRSYVAVVTTDGALLDETPDLYYAVLPGALLLSFSDGVIHRAIERSNADDGDGAAAPWAGQSTAIYVGEGIRHAVALEIFEVAAREQMRSRSWSNLMVLNEWKRMGQADPVAYHEANWGARLVCAGGGDFVWNEAAQTMESSAFGHPAAPLPGPSLPPALANVIGLELGLQFERIGAPVSQPEADPRVQIQPRSWSQGLRVRARLKR